MDMALVILIAILGCGVFILIRNQWVFNRQMELNYFDNKGHVVERYLDYNAMMFRFWVWDVEKLKK